MHILPSVFTKRHLGLFLTLLVYEAAVISASDDPTKSSKWAALESVGSTIELPFPNSQMILGVSGISYNEDIDTWTVCSESIIGTEPNNDATLSLPRLYHMKLDFTSGSVSFVTNEAVTVNPSDALKLEDIAAVPNTALSGTFGSKMDGDAWLVSEANSHLVKTNVFLSKDFGAHDFTSFDRPTFSTSRLIRVDTRTGDILEEAALPDFSKWDKTYNWDASQCIGNRPFQGAHALSLISSTDPSFDYNLYVGFQSALFQDGSVPMDFSSSSTRVLVYGINSYTSPTDRAKPTASFRKSFRYDTSQLTIETYQKGAKHFNALFGMLALSESSFLMVECEDFHGFGKNNKKIINRIYHVEIDPSDTVDHCSTLLECSVDAPLKRLVWEREDTNHLDGIGWGPVWIDDRPTVALTFEQDAKIGLHIELYALDMDELKKGDLWDGTIGSHNVLQRRINAFAIGISLFIAAVLIQLYTVHRINKADTIEAEKFGKNADIDEGDALKLSSYAFSNAKLSYYALATAMMNSFLVGGLTFGYSGIALILRKEGAYAESCACGSFCAAQKEDFALISTLGFASAIGSRIFVGLFMDKQGPKTTAILCSAICFLAFLLLGVPKEEELSTYFLPAWILLSIGGSGLHLTGFHFTNLFRSDGKRLASVAISTAFGASSGIFPIMQVLSQYADVKLKSMSIFYAVLVGIIGLNNIFIQPWNTITPGSSFDLNFAIYRKEWWLRDLKTKPILTSIFAEVRKFDFYGEMLCYTFCLLLLTHYISTSGQLMFELGDVPFTNEPNAWDNFIITRMAGWSNALGFVWFPLVRIILLKVQWPRCYEILLATNIAVFIVIQIRNLEIQILGFSLLSFSRLLLFSSHHAYLLDKFGIEFFGTMNGISSLFAAIIGFSSYPLQLLALRFNYALSFVPIGLFVLLALAFPLISRRQQFQNWAETVTVDPKRFRYPENVEEVKHLVLRNEKIRCAGAMHSCAPLIASEGIIMSLTKMNKILHIDPEKMTVRCQSGVRIYKLCEALAPHGLAVGTLGTIDWQTLSGAVMTGTHGGGLTVPSLHTFISSYTIVKADGSVMKVSKESDTDLFLALAPSMGVFGVVVEMEMECVPLQILEARLEVISFDALASEHVFQDLMEKNRYARVVVYPSINKATVWYANPITNEDANKAIKNGAFDSTGGYMNFRNENEKAWLEEYVILDKKSKYKEADDVLHKVVASQESRLGRYVGQYNHILCKERNNGIPHADIEFNFDFRCNLQVLKTVWEYCQHNRMPYYNFEMRTTKEDDAMLSCCNGRDAMWIDFQAKAADSTAFFGEIESVLKSIGFRKHWAKGLGNTDPSYVVTQFPMMSAFVKLMAQFDPEGKFRNIEGELWYQEMTDLVDSLKDNAIPTRRLSLGGRGLSIGRRSSLIGRRSSLRSNSSVSIGSMPSERRRSLLASSFNLRNEAVAYELAESHGDESNVHDEDNVHIQKNILEETTTV